MGLDNLLIEETGYSNHREGTKYSTNRGTGNSNQTVQSGLDILLKEQTEYSNHKERTGYSTYREDMICKGTGYSNHRGDRLYKS